MANNNSETVRIDKYLWAVRLFKTRSLAADACKNGRILMNEQHVKSSRLLSQGDVFQLKKPPIICTFRVKEVLKNRVGAKLVENYLENLTPEEELQKLEINVQTVFVKRDKGAGRPTKKERREIDKLRNLY